MIRKLTVPMMLLVSAVLVLLAEIATSTSIFILWHEPDCPEELLK